MAFIETVVNKVQDLTVHTIMGEVDGDEIIEKIRAELVSPYTYYVIWNFTHAQVRDLSMETMRQIMVTSKKLSESRKKGKIAIVVPQDLGFGFGRMYETYAEIESFPTLNRTFRSMAKAWEWLDLLEG